MLRWFQGLLAVVVCIVCGAPNLTSAQDWTDGSFTLWNSFGSQGSGDGQFQQADGITVDENGLIYISDYQLHRIQVFQADGTFVRKWGSQGSGTNQFQNPRGLDIGPDGNLYVCDWGNHRICVYQPDGTFVRSWGSYGTGDGQFNHPYRISVNSEGQVFVADYSNYRVQAFDENGIFIRKFEPESETGSSEPPEAIAALDDGSVLVGQKSGNPVYVVKYDGQGVRGVAWQIPQWSFSQCKMGGLDVSARNDVVASGIDVSWPSTQRPDYTDMRISDESGNTLHLYHDMYSTQYQCINMAFCPDLSIAWLLDYHTVNINRWLNREAGIPSDKLGCWTKIENVQQRGGYPYLDIDFRANSDNGTTNATVAMCAFQDGNLNLANLIPMRTFVDGTETNLGANVELSADVKRVTWNMAADWSADSGNVQVQAVVQDGPYYLPFNFLTIPAGGGVSNSFQICRTPATSADLMPAWMFLVAANDPGVELIDGKVYGTSGGYAGVELANDSATTTSGKNFLWERMSLRDPSTEELQWAKEAGTPGTTQWTPRYKVGGRPSKVNEFGLDTGATSGFWAVKQ